VKPNQDWRSFTMRPIEAPSAAIGGAYKASKGGYSNIWSKSGEQGDFSPEMGKGTLAVSSQTPEGSPKSDWAGSPPPEGWTDPLGGDTPLYRSNSRTAGRSSDDQDVFESLNKLAGNIETVAPGAIGRGAAEGVRKIGTGNVSTVPGAVGTVAGSVARSVGSAAGGAVKDKVRSMWNKPLGAEPPRIEPPF
jgi:hypothetical protein